MRPVTVFASDRGNAFMTDIARWIVEAASQSGREASLVQDRLPVADGTINLVVAPHELFVLADATDADVARAAAASVPICTEQPGTPWFNLTAGIARDAPLAIDISPRGVAALRARGLDAVHLQLGGVPSMQADVADRDLDVLFLGGSTPRRGAELSALGELQRRGTRGGAIAQRHTLDSPRSHELVALDEVTPREDDPENDSPHDERNNSGTNGKCASARWI
mgnify:CR=1 FL=1